MSALRDPQWVALSKKRQAELIEKYRETCDYEWWDGVYDNFKNDAASAGIRVDDIAFSGFWCQGDGAAFKGAVDDWWIVLRDQGLLLKAHTYIPHDEWYFRSNISRGNNMSFDSDLAVDTNPYDEDEDPLQHACFALRNLPADEVLEDIEHALFNKFNELADRLYRDLEAEYEWLTSDENTVDWILNNLTDEEIAEPEEEEEEEFV